MEQNIRKSNTLDKWKIKEAWHQGYGRLFQYFYPERFNWLFYENPFYKNKKNLPIIVYEFDNKIVSWVCEMKVKTFIQELLLDSALTINAYTLPNYRRKGLNSSIYHYVSKSNELKWSIYMSDENRRNKKRLGWLKGKPQYQFICRTGSFDGSKLTRSITNYLQRHNKSTLLFIFRILKMFGIKFILSSYAHFVIRKKTNFTITNKDIGFIKIQWFDNIWDELWIKIRLNYAFGCDRSSEYMNWKYVNQPHVNFKKYFITANGKKVGVIIFRAHECFETPHGIIAEVLLINEASEMYNDAVNFACLELKKSGCQYIYIATASNREKKYITSNGFKINRVNIPLLNIPQSIEKKIKLNKLLTDSFSWLLSMGDQDMDQVEFEKQPGMTSIILLSFNIVPGMNHQNE